MSATAAPAATATIRAISQRFTRLADGRAGRADLGGAEAIRATTAGDRAAEDRHAGDEERRANPPTTGRGHGGGTLVRRVAIVKGWPLAGQAWLASQADAQGPDDPAVHRRDRLSDQLDRRLDALLPG